MFQEVLRIKPVLEPASTKRMETTLSQRFTRVSKRFAWGLKAAVSGTIIGIGLNILAKLLNPIQELEEKMNALLGKGKDTAELADRFGTTSGKVLRIQAAAALRGVDPDDLQKMMEKYAEAIEAGRDEIDKPLKEQSEATKILGQDFLGDKDLAEGFFKFIQSLKTVTDPDERSRIEKEVLGERLTGRKKSFSNLNFDEVFGALPELQQFEKAGKNLNLKEMEVNFDRVLRETNSFLQNANSVNGGTVSSLGALENARAAKDNKEFGNFNELAVTARGLEAAMAGLKVPLEQIQKAIAKGVPIFEALSRSRQFRNMMGLGEK